jgi:hypothetical protein
LTLKSNKSKSKSKSNCLIYFFVAMFINTLKHAYINFLYTYLRNNLN